MIFYERVMVSRKKHVVPLTTNRAGLLRRRAEVAEVAEVAGVPNSDPQRSCREPLEVSTMQHPSLPLPKGLFVVVRPRPNTAGLDENPSQGSHSTVNPPQPRTWELDRVCSAPNRLF